MPHRTTLALLLCLLVCHASHASADSPSDMVRLAGGAFTMGRDDGPADERPAHTVTLAPFWLDIRPVTNAEFAAFLQRSGRLVDGAGRRLFDWDDDDARLRRRNGEWRADPGFADHPVVEASWYGSVAYCAALGKRLPSEAEWEFAARGTTARRYPWGDAAPDATRARFGQGWGETVPVAARPAGATPEGIHDLTGNVHQWTSSIARPYPYRADDGREHPDRLADRVTRGGAADTGRPTLRSTWRGKGVSRRATAGHHNIGFRCARDAH